MKRYHIIVEGRVQGVGYRYFVQNAAVTSKLTGSVRNLTNGMVEIFAQGHERDLDNFLKALEKGSYYSRVENVSYKNCPVIESEKKFTVKY